MSATVASRGAAPVVKKRRSKYSLTLGRVVTTSVSMEDTLLVLAHELVSLSPELRIRLPKVRNHVSRQNNTRPCIFLGYTENGGQCVIPMGTFLGSPPDTWDLLLQEIVLPVGDNETLVSPLLRDRKLYDSIPPWAQADGLPVYILPRVVTLPSAFKLKPLRETISEAAASELERHCRDVAQRLVSGKAPGELRTMIDSFLTYRKNKKKEARAAQYGDGERPQSQGSDYTDTSSTSSIATTSSLNPQAEEFVPRALSRTCTVQTVANDAPEAPLSPLRFHRNVAAVRGRRARKLTTKQVAVDPEVEKENVPTQS